ncbi:MAG TPA: helix-turn-helix domain-containing protein [Chloroflexota bacterium]|nr:helix-turn-helix domain-containing protein [Chloroflexota bacterium]
MTPTARARDAEARRARAERILDAAGELLLRWGYKRFTMDDVAEHAGIGKGTIYLHWTTREDLFMAVIGREFGKAVEELVAAMREDPRAALLHRLLPRWFRALRGRPLVCAAVGSDPDVLGKLKEGVGRIVNSRMRCGIDDYLRLHAEYGLLRQDFSVEELSCGIRSVMRGFFMADAMTPEDHAIPLERKAELLEAVFASAFETSQEPPEEALQAISARAIDIFTDVAEYFQAQQRQAYE